METIKLTKGGHFVATGGHNLAMVKVAQALGRVSAGSVAALTDSSGGTASETRTVSFVAADLTNEANDGGSLSNKTAAENALGTVKDGLRELAAKANAVAAALGADAMVYNGGGAAPNGTLAAVTVSVTTASAGCQAAETNGVLNTLNQALFDVAMFTNKLCDATGIDKLQIGPLTSPIYRNTVPEIVIATGSVVNPGVPAAALNAKLTSFRTALATIAARVNALRAGIGEPGIVVTP